MCLLLFFILVCLSQSFIFKLLLVVLMTLNSQTTTEMYFFPHAVNYILWNGIFDLEEYLLKE